jgi:hypothetical protein
VIAIRLCRRIAIATRGWTSSAARSDPQVRRVSWIVIRRTPYRLHLASNQRLTFLGLSGRPFVVVKISVCGSPQMHRRG